MLKNKIKTIKKIFEMRVNHGQWYLILYRMKPNYFFRKQTEYLLFIGLCRKKNLVGLYFL